MLRKIIAIPAILAAFFISPTVSFAATDVSTMSVSATVISGSIISVGNLNFGVSNTAVANVDAAADIIVNVSTGVPYTIALDGGANAVGGNRYMSNGASTLLYALYTDAARTLPWLVNGTVSGSGSNTGQTITVYGRLPNTGINTGNFSDTVTVTLTY